MLGCKEFVNADEIAKGLSPFQPETVAFEAGRIMLRRVKELVRTRVDFAFETTLSAKSYIPFVKETQAEGYTVTMIFFWLESVELARERVAKRVSEGGHNIPVEIIERRYFKGLQNLQKFIALVDNWIVCDNTNGFSSKVSDGSKRGVLNVYNDDIWANMLFHGK